MAESSGGKGHKIGTHLTKCKRYEALGKREKNKKRKAERRAKRFERIKDKHFASSSWQKRQIEKMDRKEERRAKRRMTQQRMASIAVPVDVEN